MRPRLFSALKTCGPPERGKHGAVDLYSCGYRWRLFRQLAFWPVGCFSQNDLLGPADSRHSGFRCAALASFFDKEEEIGLTYTLNFLEIPFGNGNSLFCEKRR